MAKHVNPSSKESKLCKTNFLKSSQVKIIDSQLTHFTQNLKFSKLKTLSDKRLLLLYITTSQIAYPQFLMVILKPLLAIIIETQGMVVILSKSLAILQILLPQPLKFKEPKFGTGLIIILSLFQKWKLSGINLSIHAYLIRIFQNIKHFVFGHLTNKLM